MGWKCQLTVMNRDEASKAIPFCLDPSDPGQNLQELDPPAVFGSLIVSPGKADAFWGGGFSELFTEINLFIWAYMNPDTRQFDPLYTSIIFHHFPYRSNPGATTMVPPEPALFLCEKET